MNTFGDKFRVEIFGESHGPAIGVVVDGAKAGLPLSVEDFMADISRRKSGAKGTTPRVEADMPEILSGVFEGHTTGAPVAIVFRNTNTRSGDYAAFMDLPRPGHADYTALQKWGGFNDPRGGGHFSGRITLSLVAAGVIAKKMVDARIRARLVEVGGVCREDALSALMSCEGSDSGKTLESGPSAGNASLEGVPDSEIWGDALDKAIRERDSVGGIVECRVEGVKAGLGEPFFDSVESLIAHAVFAIPGVRGIEFGDGFAAARMRGSEHNDALEYVDGEVRPAKNGAGGVNGGITNGGPIVFRVAFKPTSSIAKEQETLNVKTMKADTLVVPGRHDACFALRAPVIVEAVTAITLANLGR